MLSALSWLVRNWFARATLADIESFLISEQAAGDDMEKD
jgi:hypothetical protein